MPTGKYNGRKVTGSKNIGSMWDFSAHTGSVKIGSAIINGPIGKAVGSQSRISSTLRVRVKVLMSLLDLDRRRCRFWILSNLTG